MRLNEINIRDPFIFAEDGTYYMYGTRGAECWQPGSGTGLDVYTSADLENWETHASCLVCEPSMLGRLRFWAPEVHKFEGKYYLFVTLSDTADDSRGTWCFSSKSPLGPFKKHSTGPLTPEGVLCLDGTLYVENGMPYLVYCDEWIQYEDKLGKMCAVRLDPTLTRAEGEPVFLFDAKAAGWADQTGTMFVTDGPFLFQDAAGRLGMIWSSNCHGKYVEAAAFSESGSVLGPWKQCEKLVFENDGGHGMFFRTFGGKWKFIFHSPNDTLKERPVLLDVPSWLNLK